VSPASIQLWFFTLMFQMPPSLPDSRSAGVGFGSQRRWAFAVSAVSIVLSAYVLGACSHTPDQGLGPEVKKLRFEGNEAVSDRTLREKIVTEATPWWWPFARTRRFDPLTWEKDAQRIARYYETQGYFTATVQMSQVDDALTRDADGEVELCIETDEGPQTRVQKLEVEGLGQLEAPVYEATLKRLPVREGKAFRESAWIETKDLVRERLRERGYAAVDISGRALVDTATHSADVLLRVDTGARYRFGDIHYEMLGEPGVQQEWIEEQVRLAIAPDETFSDSALKEAERRIRGMNVFSGVIVSASDPDAATQTVPVAVQTRTAPFHTLKIGGGAGVDQVRNQVRLVAEWHDRNFKGGLRSLRIRSLVGWAFLPSLLTAGQANSATARNGLIYRVSADFEQPRLFGFAAWSLGWRVQSQRRLQEAFTALSAATGPQVYWQLRSDLRLSFGYTIDGSFLETLADVELAAIPLTLGCSENPCFSLLSYIGQRATLDRRDNPVSPKRGYYLDLQLSEGGGPLGGDFDFIRVLTDARGYISVGRWTFAARAQLGRVFPASGNAADSPIQQRLFAGGAVSMRGFGSRRLSPLLAIDRGDDKYLFLPIGGNGLIVGSAEARLQISKSALLAGFFDTGTVTRESSLQAALERLHHAVGGGVRFVTPVGAIRLDFAFRLPSGPAREVVLAGGVVPFSENKGCFGFGGGGGSRSLGDGLCQFHLSIGEAF